jgi:hypothetical protein
MRNKSLPNHSEMRGRPAHPILQRPVAKLDLEHIGQRMRRMRDRNALQFSRRRAAGMK